MNKPENLGPIWCHTQDEIPKEKHWAILETGSVREEGYDVGDPSTTKNFIEYIAYLDKALWEAEIIKRARDALQPRFGTPKAFIPIEVNPVHVETSISVKVG
jgi:hypothetical protein